MRNPPTYDWNWYTSKAPFKKILTDTCNLSISTKIEKYDYYSTITHYKIRVDFKAFQKNFETIKQKLINTRICKHNKEVFDYVENLKCNKFDLGFLIMEGCIKSTEQGSYEWDWCED